MVDLPLVWLLALYAAAASAFEWTSRDSLPNGVVVSACPGQDVTLAWSYTAAAAEHMTNVEWHYTRPGGQEIILATEIMGNFLTPPGSSQHLQYIPNAGIRLQNMGLSDSGTYSVRVNMDLHGTTVRHEQYIDLHVSDQPLTVDGQLHVEMLPTDPVYDSSTQEFHVQLACGQFKPEWESRVAVVWRTPTGQIISGSNYDNGRFLLSVPNPVVSGDYTCLIDENSPASLCVQSGSPLHRGTTVNVDGMQARMVVTLFTVKALVQEEAQQNADIQTKLEVQQRQVSALQEQNAVIQAELNTTKQENTALRQRIDSLQLGGTTSREVLFHARLRTHATLYNGKPLIPDYVNVNLGSAYNSISGQFVVPFDGYYFFTATTASQVYSTSSFYYTNLYLMVDDSAKALIYARSVDYHEEGMCTYGSHLRAGQRVWLQAAHDGQFYDQMTTFSGFLIKAD